MKQTRVQTTPKTKQNGSPFKSNMKQKNKGVQSPKVEPKAMFGKNSPKKSKKELKNNSPAIFVPPKKVIEDEEDDDDDSDELLDDSGADVGAVDEDSDADSDSGAAKFADLEAEEVDGDEEESDGEDDEEDEEVESSEDEQIAADDDSENGAEEQDEEDNDSADEAPVEEAIIRSNTMNKKPTRELDGGIKIGPIPDDIPNDRVICVQNLSGAVDINDFTKVFAKYGTITHFHQINIKNGKSIAFAAYATTKAAKIAVTASKMVSINGKKVRVTIRNQKNSVDKMEQVDQEPADKNDKSEHERAGNKGFDVFVNHISAETTMEQVKAHFEKCGTINNVKLNKRKTVAIAFITFDSEEGANAALKLHNSNLNGTTISVFLRGQGPVKDPKLTILLVNNGKFESYPEEKIRRIFEKCGELRNVTVICKKSVLAFITFTTEEAVKHANKLNGTTVDDLEIEIKPFTLPPPKTTVYVQNVRPGTTEQQIRDVLSSAGEIQTVITRSNYAVVQFKDVDGFCKSFLLNESFLQGQIIFLEPYSDKKAAILKRHHHGSVHGSPMGRQQYNPGFAGSSPRPPHTPGRGGMNRGTPRGGAARGGRGMRPPYNPGHAGPQQNYDAPHAAKRPMPLKKMLKAKKPKLSPDN